MWWCVYVVVARVFKLVVVLVLCIGYLSDNGSPRERGQADMSAFRNVVEDCLESETKSAEKSGKLDRSKTSKDPLVEKFSGLRIR